MTTPWNHRYAQRTRQMGSSAIRELLKLTEQSDIISFAGGLPASEFFPIEAFKHASDTVLSEIGPQALQYGATEGYRPLREMIARHMARYGIVVDIDNVLITSGSQQALDLIGKILINRGDRILTEEPTYLGALQAFNAYGPSYVTVPIEDDGLRIDKLEEALRAGPKFMYILPNFQNPSGVTLSLEKRLELVRLADRYGVPIVEDDPYGQLRYEGKHIKPIVALDSEYFHGAPDHYSGNVIYLSTFSKTLAPGLRLGWVVAPKDVIDHLVQAKQGSDLHTSTFIQMVTYEVARAGFIDQHVRRLREIYRRRRNAMLDALANTFPDRDSGVRWTNPEGGLFLWVSLPEKIDATELLKEALKEKVAFVPGGSFYPNGGHRNSMRLNFSNATEEMIEQGIRRLGHVIERQLSTSAVLA